MLPSQRQGARSASVTIRRILYVIACLAPAWAAVTIISDGIAWRIGPLRISSTEPVRPALVGMIAAAWYAWRYPRSLKVADGVWLAQWLRRASVAALPLFVALGVLAGLCYGTYSAAGSDAFGYVSQAELWLHGDLRVEQPIVQEVSWPDAAWTFTPLGYRPVSESGDIAPTYAPGLPMLMAVFQAVGGRTAAFVVVPVTGGIALLATFLLGRAATQSSPVGALATLLLLVSPAFLAHTFVPMSDVPVTAAWALACVLALREPPRPLACGLVAGVALLIRPNLLPLVVTPIVAWAWRERFRPHLLLFVAGLLPGLIAIALVNYGVYGSPFTSGYGRLSDIYGLSAAPQNLRNYSVWLWQTQSPLIALAAIALVTGRGLRSANQHFSPRAALAALMVLVFVSYVFYAPFENWTYLRFLLPAYPALFILMAAGVRVVSAALPVAMRAAAAIFLAALCVSTSFQFARNQFIFNWRLHEHRYVTAGERAAELTPPGAVLFSSQHSGSLRYYANRITLRYDLLSKEHLDGAVRQLSAMGKPSFLVIDDWELDEFKSRFAGQSYVTAVARSPLLRIPGPPDVLIYDLSGRAE